MASLCLCLVQCVINVSTQAEVNTANNTNDANVPRHDVLEVNNYFISGLASSAIDNWFIGPIPEFHPHDLGILGYNHSTLNEALNHAFRFAVDSSHMTWQTVRISFRILSADNLLNLSDCPKTRY